MLMRFFVGEEDWKGGDSGGGVCQLGELLEAQRSG